MVPCMYDRRTVLTRSGVLLTAGIAGCATPEGDRPVGRLAWISLTNDSDDPHEVRVIVSETDRTAFFETYQLGTESESANAYVEKPVSESGDYKVQATTSNQIISIPVSKLVDGDERCVGVDVLITTGGTLQWDSKSMEEC